MAVRSHHTTPFPTLLLGRLMDEPTLAIEQTRIQLALTCLSHWWTVSKMAPVFTSYIHVKWIKISVTVTYPIGI